MSNMPKKILLVMQLSTIDWGSQNSGGLDSVCQMFAEQLVKNTNNEFNYRILAVDTLNTQTISGDIIKLSDNVELVWVSRGLKLFGRLPIPTICYLIFKVRQQVNEFNPDVVHSHTWSWILGFSRKIPSIVTVHGYKNIARRSVSPLNDWFYVKVLPNISKFFGHLIVCVGEQVKVAVEKDVKQEIRIIGNPIDADYFCNVDRTSYKKSLKLVTCALLTPRKQVEKVILLAEMLNNSGIDIELVIIGPASDKDYVELLYSQVENSALVGKITFAGRLNKNNIIEHYKQSDVGVFFSKEETFGLAPLEMLAAGLPLIATEVGILAERKAFFESIGVTFVNVQQPKEVLTIALNFVQTLRSPNFHLLQREFSVGSVVNQYESLYHELSDKC